jgi:hypothetical protein
LVYLLLINPIRDAIHDLADVRRHASLRLSFLQFHAGVLGLFFGKRKEFLQALDGFIADLLGVHFKFCPKLLDSVFQHPIARNFNQ